MSEILVLTGTAGVIGGFRSRALFDTWMRNNDYVKIPEGVKVNGIPSGAFLIIPNIDNPTPAQALVVHTEIEMYDSIVDIDLQNSKKAITLAGIDETVPEHVACKPKKIDGEIPLADVNQGQDIPCGEE